MLEPFSQVCREVGKTELVTEDTLREEWKQKAAFEVEVEKLWDVQSALADVGGSISPDPGVAPVKFGGSTCCPLRPELRWLGKLSMRPGRSTVGRQPRLGSTKHIGRG
ncbi:hypothetical protein GUJ93_ZPchr0015g6872 [Zizania palustris]|uniref:Uncharacterized protein n=1 Tax=Zizania palustris TaxID=103762 RepID=A0A8J5VVI9_ZIZPA|nr:hypothetical protein GUJ93_ZPchr0015g6872 [Zizania palustris]